jgi:hypothetical protein
MAHRSDNQKRSDLGSADVIDIPDNAIGSDRLVPGATNFVLLARDRHWAEKEKNGEESP